MVDNATDTQPAASEPPASAERQERARPIQNRFLFVDVAAKRAKQLRRGARPRLPGVIAEPAPAGQRPDAPRKLERLAMEEVQHGLILYELPEDAVDQLKEAI